MPAAWGCPDASSHSGEGEGTGAEICAMGSVGLTGGAAAAVLAHGSARRACTLLFDTSDGHVG